MLLGLTTGQEIGLLVFAGIFIAFSLAASFLFPRRNPDWPGRRLGSFIAVTIVLFVAMMTAVFVLAKEAEEGAHAEPPAETATATNPEESSEGPGAGKGADQGEPGSTGETSGEQGGTGTGASRQSGDPTAGKQVFASAGCGSCHTLSDAGTSGNVGPNLDEAKPARDLVVERVTNGKAPMPSFKDQLTEKQIQDVAAYVVDATGGS